MSIVEAASIVREDHLPSLIAAANKENAICAGSAKLIFGGSQKENFARADERTTVVSIDFKVSAEINFASTGVIVPGEDGATAATTGKHFTVVDITDPCVAQECISDL